MEVRSSTKLHSFFSLSFDLDTWPTKKYLTVHGSGTSILRWKLGFEDKQGLVDAMSSPPYSKGLLLHTSLISDA